jgi:hypothetical protein
VTLVERKIALTSDILYQPRNDLYPALCGVRGLLVFGENVPVVVQNSGPQVRAAEVNAYHHKTHAVPSITIENVKDKRIFGKSISY